MLTKNKIQELNKLTSRSKARREAGLFVIEGIRMFVEAPDEMIREVYVTEDFVKKCQDSDTLAGDSELYARANTRWEQLKADKDKITDIVSPEQMKKISDTQTPQGIMCVLTQPRYNLDMILGKVATDSSPLYVVLEDIQDPGNLGTIFRTGEGAGVDGIIMSRGTVDLFNPKTIRSTMGSIYRVPFVYAEDLEGTITKLKESGVSVYAAHLKGSKDYREIKYASSAFLIGNEGNGLSDRIADMADTYIKIPMQGQLESLNAAIATALLMYEHGRR